MVLLLDRECDICNKTQHSYFKLKRSKGQLSYTCSSCENLLQKDTIKINMDIKKSLRNAVRAVMLNESHSLQDTVGCPSEFFRNHIKTLWKLNMNWDNYGLWELDHKIALCKFDLSIIKNWFIVNNWKNIQPLWIKENWTKSHKENHKTS